MPTFNWEATRQMHAPAGLRGLVALVVLTMLTLSAGSVYAWEPQRSIEVVAPAGAGGGWDTTARAMARVLTETGIVTVPMPVVNRAGGGGAVALANFVTQATGADHRLIVFSPPLLLIHLNGTSEYGYQDIQPVAKVITEYGAFVARAGSRFESIAEVMASLRDDPESVIVAGASSAGSMDHIQFLQAAAVAGADPGRIPYVSYQDVGGAITALLRGDVGIYSTSVSEVLGLLEAGQVEILAITAPERLDDPLLRDVPTLIEAGIDTTFQQWRGFFAAPQAPPEAVAFYEDALRRMVETPEWQEVLERYRWESTFEGSADFKSFLNEQNDQFRTLLEAIGVL